MGCVNALVYNLNYKRKICLVLPYNSNFKFENLKEICRESIIHGNEIKRFEYQFGKYIGVRNAVSASTGRMALYIIFKTLGFEKDDEVIIPAYMLPMLPMIATYFKLKPVFVDINPNTFNINVEDLRKKITNKTKAILAVHLFGQPCQIDEIIEIARKRDILVIEDCAQALGASFKGKKVGSYGDINFFSFNSSKNITTFGGGMIVTNDDILADKIRDETTKLPWPNKYQIKQEILSRNWNWFLSKPINYTLIMHPLLRIIYKVNKESILDYYKSSGVRNPDYISEKDFLQSYGHRYSNIQASVGLKLLDLIDEYIKSINKNAKMLDYLVKNPPEIIDGAISSYYRYAIKIRNSKTIATELFKRGILTTNGSYLVLPDMNIFNQYHCPCPTARKISESILYIPVQPYLKRKDFIRIVEILNDIKEYRAA